MVNSNRAAAAAVLIAAIAIGSVVGYAPMIDIRSSDVKCFLEEVPADTPIQVTFNLSPLPGVAMTSETATGLKVWINDPNGNTVSSMAAPLVTGAHTYTTTAGGEYKICMTTNASAWFSSSDVYRLTVDVRSGVAAVDYKHLAKTEHLSGIEVSLRKANDRVSQIKSEQGYQKDREAEFIKISQSTGRKVLVFAFFQIAILAGCAVWEIKHLHSFFRKKKFV